MTDDQPTPRAPERLLHNGHTYEPGRDEDAFDLRDPRWCNTCGEGIDKPLHPIPRAPEQEAVVRDVLEKWLHRAHGVVSSHIHDDWFIDWLGERGYGVAPDPAPNNLREQIGHALETARCTHHESDACYDCEAVAIMDVLRRNGVIS